MKQCNYSDEELIQMILAGGQQREKAMHCVFHLPGLRGSWLNYVRSKKGREEDARDCYQDAMIIFMESVLEGKYKGGKIKSFIFSTCKNIWRRKRTKGYREELREDPPPETEKDLDEAVLLYLEDKECRELLRKVIGALNKRCQLALILWMNDYSMNAIAEIMGLDDQRHAISTKYNCLQRLMRALEKDPALRIQLQENCR